MEGSRAGGLADGYLKGLGTVLPSQQGHPDELLWAGPLGQRRSHGLDASVPLGGDAGHTGRLVDTLFGRTTPRREETSCRSNRALTPVAAATAKPYPGHADMFAVHSLGDRSDTCSTRLALRALG